jgi:hypothetical protein
MEKSSVLLPYSQQRQFDSIGKQCTNFRAHMRIRELEEENEQLRKELMELKLDIEVKTTLVKKSNENTR